MMDEPSGLSAHECALRKLPLTYSLALRLRDAGVAPEIVCEYIGVEEAALDGVYRMAEAKFNAAMSGESGAGEPAIQYRADTGLPGARYRTEERE